MKKFLSEGQVMRIKNEKELVRAVKEYLAQGKSVGDITDAVNQRGVCCYAVGIELLIKKYNLR
jgi:hypothetical protein